MKELRRKQEIKRWLYSYPSLVLWIVLAGFLVRGAFGIASIERENAHRVSALEKESTLLLEREASLEAQIGKLKTEEGILEAIKEKFSVVRDGEHVAIIVDERNKATSTKEAGEIWYLRLWNAIIGTNF